ncbi:MAG: LacI family DNA-binding transcriptional regulator [Lachnospiraceae bacterium]|nr:LacI family DNA-binding transcriptional regulator [Lachnospiraceae bacterium]
MATIKDIAKMAGVSTSTVSHVVNRTRYVSPELVEKVERVIQELDELPNFIIKKTRTNQSSNGLKYIFVLISERGSLFQRQMEESAKKLLADTEYTLVSAGYDKDTARLAVIKNMIFATPDLCGIIAFPDERGILTEAFFHEISVPVVLIGKEIKGLKADVFSPDMFDGGYQAARHLIKNGHEHIAYMGNSKDLSTWRFEGYQKALRDYGMEENKRLAFPNLNTEVEVFQVMDKMMAEEVPPTGIVVANSFPIVPLLKYLNAHNIVIPKDISVISLNDFEWAALLAPELTCIDKQPLECASLAIKTLLKRIKGEEENYQKVTLPVRLNVRNSTCGIGRGPFGEKAENAEVLELSEMEKEQIRRQNYTAAISFHYTGKAWMQLIEKGIKKIFEDLGISIIAVTDAHFEASMQCKQLESIRFLSPDLLIAIPVDSQDTAEAFQKVVQSKTKLVLITNIPDGIALGDYVSCVSVNEYSHGRNMGHGLGKYMVRHKMKYVGIVRHGNKHFYATRQRDNAAEQVLSEEFPEIQICGEINFQSEAEVYKKTKEFVKHHSEVEAFYVSWDGPALEVLRALTELDRTDVAVVTGDLDYSIAMNMAKGGMVKTLSAQCPYEQGEAIALAAANALLGKQTPSFIGIEPVLVTPENLLKKWSDIFKDNPPAELRRAIRENLPHFTME